MLNHHNEKQTTWEYYDSKNGFVISALREIRKGEQIFDSYGNKWNSRFLLNYGFYLMGNERYNEVELVVP